MRNTHRLRRARRSAQWQRPGVAGTLLCLGLSALLLGGALLAINSQAAAGPAQLVRLSITQEAGMVRIEVIADNALPDVSIQQGARQTVVRVRGARSLLRPSYAIDDPLVRSVRTATRELESGEPIAEIIIATGAGATVAQRSNFNRLTIAVAADFAHLRRSARAPGADLARAERAAPPRAGQANAGRASSEQTSVSQASVRQPPTANAPAATAANPAATNAYTTASGSGNTSPASISAGNGAAAQVAAAPALALAPLPQVFRGRSIWSNLTADARAPSLRAGAFSPLMFQQTPATPPAFGSLWGSGATVELQPPGALPGVFVPGTSAAVTDTAGGHFWGRGVLRPSLSFGGEYETPFYYLSDEGERVGIFTLAPRLEYEIPGVENALYMAYEPRIRRLTNGESANGHFFDFDARYFIARFLRLSFRDHFVRSSLDPYEYDPAGETYIVGKTFTRNDAGLRLEYFWSDRDRINLDLGYNIVRWNESRLEVPIFVDYSELSAGLTYEYDIAPEATVFTSFTFANTLMGAPLRPQFDRLGNHRRFVGEAGARIRFGEDSSFLARGGYQVTDFRHAPEENDYNGFVFDLAYQRNLTENLNFELAALRKTQVSSFNLEGGNARLMTTGLAAGLDYSPAEALELSLGGTYNRLSFPRPIVAGATASGNVPLEDSVGLRRRDNIYGFNLEAAYRVAPMLRARFGYYFTRQSSNIPVITGDYHNLSLFFELGRRREVTGRRF